MSLVRVAAGVAMSAGVHLAQAGTPPVELMNLTDSYETPAAATELQSICPQGVGYAQAWPGWRSTPPSATSGTPKIEQYRQGQLIATYQNFVDAPGCTLAGDGTDHLYPGAPATSGCGPFTRGHTYRLWEAGDTFLVYPAVYAGLYNQPWIGPEWDDPSDYYAGIFHNPDNITIQGVTQYNTRPVIVMEGAASNNTLGQAALYFDQSTGVHMDSIDVTAAPGATAGQAGIYELAASNLTLSNMRVSYFERAGVNGVFGAGSYTGTLTLEQMELDHNGGPNGPDHNAYIAASATDPNFTVIFERSWSHDAFYGHLFKSRAQVTVATANYFQGGTPTAGNTQAENYLLDVPNGGLLTARNNVFVKNASGPNSNAMSITFGMEGFPDARPQSIDVENNTFIAYAKTYDGDHLIYPLGFLYPNTRPDNAAWPANVATRILKNAYVGYCSAGDGGALDYRGQMPVTESFGEMSKAFLFATKVNADDTDLANLLPNYVPELQTPAYTSKIQYPAVRKKTTVGAED